MKVSASEMQLRAEVARLKQENELLADALKSALRKLARRGVRLAPKLAKWVEVSDAGTD